VALVKAVSVVPVLEAVVAELKAGQVELSRKIDELSAKLTETRAPVKVIDDWTIACEFAQIPRGNVLPSSPCFNLGGAAPLEKGDGGVGPCATVPRCWPALPLPLPCPSC